MTQSPLPPENNRSHLFNRWAKTYDEDLASSDDSFPHQGYEHVLDQTFHIASPQPSMRILELGIGTGNLAARFIQIGCSVYGLDLSFEMLAIARHKIPATHLIQADLLAGWPLDPQACFDLVVSAYVFHEFDFQTKIDLLKKATTNHLSPRGCILIADIAFPTIAARQQAHQKWAKWWDEDEHYWFADETIAACHALGLHGAFHQVSSCGGIFSFSHANSP
jgi:putative AdoMet-dependent methyltransferase